jgi:hypothetical protein
MNTNTCPHCGRPALSFWKKMFLGPMFKVQCAQCRNLVGVAKGKAWLSLAPWLIVARMPFIIHVHSIIPGIAAILVSSALYWWWVPLEKRSPTLDREGAPVQPQTAPTQQ